MSRRNVAFKKPADPAFIRRIKEQLGYKQPPDVHTKLQRERQGYYSDDDSEPEEESPQIVVVKRGDLTADEVARLKKEEEEAKADLSKRVIFKRPKKASGEESDLPEESKVPGGEASVGSGPLIGIKGPAGVKTCVDASNSSSKRPGPEPSKGGSGPKKTKSKSRPAPGALSFDADEDE